MINDKQEESFNAGTDYATVHIFMRYMYLLEIGKMKRGSKQSLLNAPRVEIIPKISFK